MSKIVTIGGVTPPSTLDLIDEEIIRLTNKKHPKILYIPTAGGDSLDYCERYKGIYEGKFGCQFDVLFLIKETPTEDEIKEKIFSSDIIYIGGGSTLKLIEYFKKYNIDKMLKEANEKGIVFAGISAGAICFGKCDKEIRESNNSIIKVDCLDFLEFVFCPHHNLEDYMKGNGEEFEKTLKEYDYIGLGIDNDCAIEFVDNTYRVISTKPYAIAYKVYKKGSEIVKEIILKDNNFRSIKDLLKADTL